MSSNEPTTAPLTDAELDHLDALNRARTPGTLRPFTTGILSSGQWVVHNAPGPDGAIMSQANADALAAALNALPALLAEVRASRAAASASVAPDGPRLHIPADLLTRPAGGGVR